MVMISKIISTQQLMPMKAYVATKQVQLSTIVLEQFSLSSHNILNDSRARFSQGQGFKKTDIGYNLDGQNLDQTSVIVLDIY